MPVICSCILTLQGNTQVRNQTRQKLNLPEAAGHPRGVQTRKEPQHRASTVLLAADLSQLRQVWPQWFAATAELIHVLGNPLTGN